MKKARAAAWFLFLVLLWWVVNGCAMRPGRQFNWSGHSDAYTDAGGVTWSRLGVTYRY